VIGALFAENTLTTHHEWKMREYVWLECTECGARNYRTQKETRGAERLELKKFCRKERKHTPHKESRKK
jgi:large subunit ribosomal protein L33